MSQGQNAGASSAVYNDVTRTNIAPLFRSIREHILKSKFIAIDTEFTGLVLSNPTSVLKVDTSEWFTRAADMNLKYKAMCNIVRTHALVSMGISTYSHRHLRPGSYNVNNFNFTLQQQNSHLVNSASLGFLAENGYDLNKQAVSGIRYFSGPNPEPPLVGTKEINEEGWLIRELFMDIVRARVPLVVHNGLYDLMYIYQAFFGPLPDTYPSFVYDLSEMFPGGIYDTKYIVEMNEPRSASFLAYLYHKHERKQKQRLDNEEPAVCIRIKDRIKYVPNEEDRQSEPKAESSANLPFCEQFAAHGHCRYKDRCSRSHDINFILDCQSKLGHDNSSSSSSNANVYANDNNNANGNGSGNASKEKGRNKRKREDDSNELKKSLSAKIARITQATDSKTSAQITEAAEEAGADNAEEMSLKNMYHTAAYDAFMTGFIFASYRILLGEKMADFKNKVFLMGKPDQPLLIKGGQYSSLSMTYKQTESLIELRSKNAAAAAPTEKQAAGKQKALPVSKAKAAESNSSQNGDKSKNITVETEDPTPQPAADDELQASATTAATA
ncbi:hypothetical protein LPJ56_000002 [Coemansia sp. RSA 2599]|nr:hypothetical protein LPJ56_000002 [Coemansia sp. RSA 2599]